MEPLLIREGYLVKKRTLLSCWKAVWVVLSDDGIEFYKRRADRHSKGMIPLKGATLTSSCQDFSKRMWVFKITTSKKQDYYFQATHLEEREAWVKDTKRAISHLDEGMRFSRKSTRRSLQLPDAVNLSELYSLMRDQESGVKEMTLEEEKMIYNQCFTGSAVVEWVVSRGHARDRQEGQMVATALLNEGFLQPAGEISKKAAESIVLDQPGAFYYFADSGFFSEGYSSDEDEGVKKEFRGIITKQGCLLKQGHRRKTWKVRKFILREDPACMTYYDPTKNSEDPLGSIHLCGSVVTVVDDPDAKKCDRLFEIITSDETHYFLQATTEHERKEWIEAIQNVSRFKTQGSGQKKKA